MTSAPPSTGRCHNISLFFLPFLPFFAICFAILAVSLYFCPPPPPSNFGDCVWFWFRFRYCFLLLLVASCCLLLLLVCAVNFHFFLFLVPRLSVYIAVSIAVSRGEHYHHHHHHHKCNRLKSELVASGKTLLHVFLLFSKAALCL